MKLKNLVIATIISLGLVGCNNSSDVAAQPEATADAPAATKDADTTATPEVASNPDWPTYVVATDPGNAPFEGRDENGLVEGFDVDLIKSIAEHKQFNVDIIPQPWASIFDSLESGERDILIAPLTINAERDALVDFTIPYIYPTRTAYMLPETAAKLGINSYEDLPKVKGVAAKEATTNVTSLQADFGDAINIVPVTSQYLALTAVTSGQADAGFGDTIVLKYHANDMKDIEFKTIEQTLSEPVQAGFAVKNGNAELVNLLNDGIKQVVADGTYRTLAIKWFGDELGNQVADRTEAQMQL